MLSSSSRAGRIGFISPSIRSESSAMSLEWASIGSRNYCVINAWRAVNRPFNQHRDRPSQVAGVAWGEVGCGGV